MELTDRQLSVYEYILHHHQQFSMAPTVREICEYLGLKGPAGVHRILNVLIDKGFIETIPGKKRAWRPVVSSPGGPNVSPDESKAIPLAGHIAAGTPISIYDHVEEFLPVDPALYGHESCFAVRVTGDSMIDAHIQDGDLAIIVPVNDADDGGIVAVIVDDIQTEATLKIIRRKKNTFELHSANSIYPPMIFKGRDREKVRIVGKYVGLIRSPHFS
ncbi:MAG: repressor LexA [Desulfobacteraceae bacterium]|nr:repressor LexA [Desulfobacteraceae bacterium]MBC2755258.1 repressor LexA [Desulfobacteraceae bacterium]